MEFVGRLAARVGRWLDDARRRWPAFDHTWRALDRYGELLAPRLAAAIAYYGFFAVFALALLAYWVFGLIIIGRSELRGVVADFLKQNLPFLRPEEIAESSGNVGVVGLVLLVFTGIAWIEAIRSSQRLIYGLDQQPGNLVVRRLVDLAVMVGVFILLGISVGAVDALESLLRWILGRDSLAGGIIRWLLAVPINMVVAAALLVAVPRVRISARRLWPPVMIVAVGLTLLNSVGRYYVFRAERNPAYTVVAGAVGILLYLYLLNQLVLFGATLAATAETGRIRDLAGGQKVPAAGVPPARPGGGAGP
ncbi:MAG TPA: YihY/virulence factor BrkB family protein [Micromonosporaceae bacterium]|nr:YihY/virulence factor BrkB family protein [Micromonosporaceae bacterium]